MQDLTENTCEVTSLPTTITYDLPIQIGFMVYQYAQLKMSMFYYDFLTKYLDRHNFQLCEMDTDSLYFALSSTNLDAIVIPEKSEAYYSERHLWLPFKVLDHHIVTYKQRKRGLNYQYIKRKICEDGVSTLPLDIRPPFFPLRLCCKYSIPYEQNIISTMI